MKLTFYTVYTHRPGYPVHWLDPEKYEEHTFTLPEHPFKDPGEACEEFKACAGGPESYYLNVKTFRAKVNAFKKLHQRLAEWSAGAKGVEPLGSV